MLTVTTLFIAGSLVFCALGMHPFATYPLSLMLACKFKSGQGRTAGKPGPEKISVLLCAYNEQESISQTLENLLAIRRELPGYCIEILVHDDGSLDQTRELLQAREPEIIVVEGHSRSGKSVGMNRLLARAGGEIVVFTDANVLMSCGTIEAFATAFSDEQTAVAAGHLVYTNQETTTAEVGAKYWQFEEWIKSLESRTGSVIGADGSAFAIRRDLFHPAPADVDDDFFTSIRLLTEGHRVIHCPEAIVFERSASRPEEEWSRKIRIACRGMNCHRRLRQQIHGLPLWDRYKYFSHKWVRWLTVLWFALAIGCFLGAVFSERGWRTGLEATALIGSGFLMVELLGRLRMPIVSQVREALSSLIATLIGVSYSFRGSRFETWTPPLSARTSVFEESLAASSLGSSRLPMANASDPEEFVKSPSPFTEGVGRLWARAHVLRMFHGVREGLRRQPASLLVAVFVLYLATCASNWGLTNWTSPARRSLIVLSALIGIWWGGRTDERQTWFRSPLDPVLLPLMTILALTTLVHPEELVPVSVGLWFLAASLLIYFVLQDLLANRRLTVRQLADGILLGTFPVLVDGIVRSTTSGSRAVGVFEHANYFGGLAVMMIPLALAGWRASSSTPRWTYSIYLVAAVTGLALSGSRGAMLGLIASAALVLPRRHLLYGTAAAVPLLAGAIAARWESVVLRLPVYDFTLRGILEQPLWGHGLFTFRFPQPPYVHRQAHNVLLQIAYEVGLVGLMGVLLLLIQLLRDQAQTWNPSRPPWMAVLVASAFQQLVDVTWMSPGMLLWLAIILAAWTWQPAALPRTNQQLPAKALAGLTAVVLGLGFGFGHVPMSFFDVRATSDQCTQVRTLWIQLSRERRLSSPLFPVPPERDGGVMAAIGSRFPCA